MVQPTRNFYIVIAAAAAVFFLLNSGHVSQQTIFEHAHLALASSVSEGHGYTLPGSANPSFYPMWGYAILLVFPSWLHFPSVAFILLLQLAFCLVGILLFYKAFGLDPRFWHVWLFIPWFAAMSVKWPDAIVAILIVVSLFFFKLWIRNDRPVNVFVALVVLSLAYHFRPEWLFFPIALLFSSAVLSPPKLRKKALAASVIALIIQLFVAAPWIGRSISHLGYPLWGASNGGGVLYISLGQLPGNTWRIVHHDSAAVAFARNHGIEDPWSPEANSVFFTEVQSNVLSSPGEFILKCGYNLARMLMGGVYIGELPTVVTDAERVAFVRNKLLAFENVDVLRTSSWPEILFWAIHIVLSVTFRGVFLVLSLAFIYGFVRKRHKLHSLLELFVVSLFIFSALIVSFIQYESRHMNLVYLPLLGYYLSSISPLLGRNQPL